MVLAVTGIGWISLEGEEDVPTVKVFFSLMKG